MNYAESDGGTKMHLSSAAINVKSHRKWWCLLRVSVHRLKAWTCVYVCECVSNAQLRKHCGQALELSDWLWTVPPLNHSKGPNGRGQQWQDWLRYNFVHTGSGSHQDTGAQTLFEGCRLIVPGGAVTHYHLVTSQIKLPLWSYMPFDR